MFETTLRDWPGLRSKHVAVSRVHEDDDPLVTSSLQLSIGFTGHRRLVHDGAGAGQATVDLPPGTATVTGADPVRWLRMHEPAEALEMHPDPALVARIAGTSRAVGVEPVVGGRDATLLGIASRLRAAHTGGTALDTVAAGTLAHRLAAHLLERYAGVALDPPPRGVLDARTTDRVAAFVEARLDSTITLEDLAAAANLSPHHFARVFARTTGLAPHRFVAARRMDRARRLLQSTTATVEDVALAVGHRNLSHFRRVFRAHLGVGPSAWRRDR